MDSGPQSSAPRAGPDGGQEPVAPDLAALTRGEPQAVDQLMRELFEPLYAFVYWRVGGVRADAEDVTQETLMTALATMDRFEGRSSFYTWVCGIGRNLALARLRARGRDTQPGATTEPQTAPPPDTLLERAQTERLVGLALTELAPHYQRALLDKYVHQRSFAEMAAAGGSSAKAVESIVQRAKRALAEALARVGLSRSDGDHHE